MQTIERGVRGHLIKVRLILEGDVSEIQIYGCDRILSHGSRYCITVAGIISDVMILADPRRMRRPHLCHEVSHVSLIDFCTEKLDDASVE